MANTFPKNLSSSLLGMLVIASTALSTSTAAAADTPSSPPPAPADKAPAAGATVQPGPAEPAPNAEPAPAAQEPAASAADAKPALQPASEPAPKTEPPAEAPKTGALKVVTDPPGAVVRIKYGRLGDGAAIGETPLSENLEPGPYFVEVEKEGYEIATAEIRIFVGEPAALNIRLSPEDPGVRVKRAVGHVCLWPGLALTGVGIALIEVDPQGSIGLGGYIAGGVGVVLAITGSVLLGISHKTKAVYTQPVAGIGPLPDGSGAQVSVGGRF